MKQILSIDVPTLRPRNPLAVPARLRRAGRHGRFGGAARQLAERALRRELDGHRPHRPPPSNP